jgi:Acyl-CoA dehydrogenases
MDFELNEEQQQIKYSVREFAESEIRPHVMEWDESQHFPDELRPKLAELGLMGVLFPEQYGGAGMGYVEYATIIEELGRVDGSVGLSVAAHNSLCSNHIYSFGSEEQKQKYLVPLAQGESFGAWGLTESQAGSDASGTHHSHSFQRRLEGERLKEFHHSRDRLQHSGCRRGHRQSKRQPRHLGVHFRQVDGGLSLGQEREQGRNARL